MLQAEYLGLTIPDPDLKWNAERDSFDIGAIDWDEFYQVIGGDGPCNKQRLAARIEAWEEGRWYRDGLMAHASKKAALRATAAS